jgi:hypothetical protein
MRAQRLGYLVVGLLPLPGCGGNDLAEVSGAVAIDGQPVTEGSIQFIPIEGTTGPGAGAPIENGRYHIPRQKGVAVGKNRVELRAFKKTGRKVQDPTGLPGTLTEERVPAFPKEYNDSSTVVREVQAGSNTIDFLVQLSTKGK